MAIKVENVGGLQVWKRFVIAVLWLVIPSLLGLIVATINHEHGSIGFVVLGIYVGASGAIGYMVLCLSPSFRRLKTRTRLIACTTAAALPVITIASYQSLFSAAGIAAAFACICGVTVAQLEARWFT
jgi:hypothetical protein